MCLANVSQIRWFGQGSDCCQGPNQIRPRQRGRLSLATMTTVPNRVLKSFDDRFKVATFTICCLVLFAHLENTTSTLYVVLILTHYTHSALCAGFTHRAPGWGHSRGSSFVRWVRCIFPELHLRRDGVAVCRASQPATFHERRWHDEDQEQEQETKDTACWILLVSMGSVLMSSLQRRNHKFLFLDSDETLYQALLQQIKRRTSGSHLPERMTEWPSSSQETMICDTVCNNM